MTAAQPNSTGAPCALPHNTLEALIDALIPLADEVMDHGSEIQRDRLHELISHVTDLAIAEDALKPNLRLKARAMRLIYAGDELGLEDGLRRDALNGGSRAEQLALQIVSVMANAR